MAKKANPVVAQVENYLAHALKVGGYAAASAVLAYTAVVVAQVHDRAFALYLAPVVNAAIVYCQKRLQTAK